MLTKFWAINALYTSWNSLNKTNIFENYMEFYKIDFSKNNIFCLYLRWDAYFSLDIFADFFTLLFHGINETGGDNILTWSFRKCSSFEGLMLVSNTFYLLFYVSIEI